MIDCRQRWAREKEKTSKGRGEEEENFVGTLTVSTAPELLASEQKNQESRTRDKSEEEEEEEEGKEGQVPASRFFLPLDFTNVTLALRIVEGVPLVVKEEKYENLSSMLLKRMVK